MSSITEQLAAALRAADHTMRLDDYHADYATRLKIRKALAAFDDAIPTWTVFIVDDNGDHPTTFVTIGHGLRSNAIKAAMEECAEAWEQRVDSLRLLGVAEGEVRLVEWHDE